VPAAGRDWLPVPIAVRDVARIDGKTPTEMTPLITSPRPCRAMLLTMAGALAVAASFAGAAPPHPDESELLAAGFRVLAASTTVQSDWVRSLPPGQIRPMQRNGKKYFVYPDAPRNRIYVGGPKEYLAYRERHPEAPPGTKDAANSAYRAKQDAAMRAATARDLSDPFLGASWADLGW
jgi:hypothetical protein